MVNFINFNITKKKEKSPKRPGKAHVFVYSRQLKDFEFKSEYKHEHNEYYDTWGFKWFTERALFTHLQLHVCKTFKALAFKALIFLKTLEKRYLRCDRQTPDEQETPSLGQSPAQRSPLLTRWRYFSRSCRHLRSSSRARLSVNS